MEFQPQEWQESGNYREPQQLEVGDPLFKAYVHMTPSSSLISALCCVCLCTDFLSFPDNMMEIGLPSSFECVLLVQPFWKRKFSLSQIEIPGKKLLDPVWIMYLLPNQCAVAREWCYMYKHDRPQCNLHWGGEQLPKGGWLSRRSSRFYPNKHIRKRTIVYRRGYGAEWVGLLKNANCNGSNTNLWSNYKNKEKIEPLLGKYRNVNKCQRACK